VAVVQERGYLLEGVQRTRARVATASDAGLLFAIGSTTKASHRRDGDAGG
jgi:hypothetical protein